MKNVLSWKEAMDQGLDARMYTYQADEVPVGAFIAVLDFKVWAKQAMGIGCYFSQAGSGLKFVVTVFRGRYDGDYLVKDCPIDFTECSSGVEYRLEVERNRQGNPYLVSAVLVERVLVSEAGVGQSGQ